MAGDSGKNSKIGRNKIWCKGYRDSRMREQNKLRRMARHAARLLRNGHVRDASGKRIAYAMQPWMQHMDADWQTAFKKINAVLPNGTIKRILNEKGLAFA